jgi:hypothetical protein
MAGTLYPQGKSPKYPLDMKLGEPQYRSGRCGEQKRILSLQGIETQLSNGRPFVIPTELSEFNKSHTLITIEIVLLIQTTFFFFFFFYLD